ncbi:MAG: hypothetical protein WAT39_19130 [Planctomycetota bacterium]
MLPLLLVPFLAAQGPGFVAAVTDPISHGTVGDALLSLDEAIRVANGTLAISQLSAAEQACFAGTGPLVETILIDAAVTPTITLQAPLTDLTGPTGVHQHIAIMGMAMPGNPKPVIQGGAHLRVFTLRYYGAMLHGLRIVGGQVGVDARMPQPAAPAAHMAEIMECEFSSQTVAAIRVHGTGTDESMVMVEDSAFTNMPVGILLDDQTAGGMVMVEAERTQFDAVVLGCRVVEHGAGGANMSMFNLYRSSFVNGTTLAEQRRQPTAAQQFMFRIVHTQATCSGDVLDIEGNGPGLTMVHHHHSDFVAGPGQKAFSVWPRTATFDIHGSEMRFVGDIAIATNLQTPRLWQQNNRYENGTITLDVDGALPNLLWNQFDNCTIVVPPTARSPVVLRSSELDDTPVNASSFLAPVTLQGCWRAGSSALSGFASELQAAGGPFLGRTTVTPPDPQVGATVAFTADLPFGIGLVWDVVDSYARPYTAQEPFRLYGDPATLIALPGMVVFQSQIVVPIPNVPGLVGLEFYVQGISLPLLPAAWAPPFHLPRGGLVRLRA